MFSILILQDASPSRGRTSDRPISCGYNRDVRLLLYINLPHLTVSRLSLSSNRNVIKHFEKYRAPPWPNSCVSTCTARTGVQPLWIDCMCSQNRLEYSTPLSHRHPRPRTLQPIASCHRFVCEERTIWKPITHRRRHSAVFRTTFVRMPSQLRGSGMHTNSSENYVPTFSRVKMNRADSSCCHSLIEPLIYLSCGT
jgi:hypothetical protein